MVVVFFLSSGYSGFFFSFQVKSLDAGFVWSGMNHIWMDESQSLSYKLEFYLPGPKRNSSNILTRTTEGFFNTRKISTASQMRDAKL